MAASLLRALSVDDSSTKVRSISPAAGAPEDGFAAAAGLRAGCASSWTSLLSATGRRPSSAIRHFALAMNRRR